MSKLRIREILKERGISINEFADKLGIQRQNVYNTLDKPTYQRLEQVADILSMPIYDLFDKETDDIIGFIEFKGTVHRINSLRNLESVTELIKSEILNE